MIKISKFLQADFTVLKPLKIKEQGTTRSSLENMKKIYDAGYDLESAILTYDTKKNDVKLICVFTRDHKVETHTFLGFNIGYGGEGPRGLMEGLKVYGIDFNAMVKPSETQGRIKFK